MMGKPGKPPSVKEMVRRLNEQRRRENLEPVPEGTLRTYITLRESEESRIRLIRMETPRADRCVQKPQ
jgi:hypothetical protein